ELPPLLSAHGDWLTGLTRQSPRRSSRGRLSPNCMAGSLVQSVKAVSYQSAQPDRVGIVQAANARIVHTTNPAVALLKLTSEADMTTRRQSERFEESVSRRGLVQALTAGATASVFATPSSAQQTTALAEATSADYVRDPTRWGSPEVAALFPGFKHLDMR